MQLTCRKFCHLSNDHKWQISNYLLVLLYLVHLLICGGGENREREKNWNKRTQACAVPLWKRRLYCSFRHLRSSAFGKNEHLSKGDHGHACDCDFWTIFRTEEILTLKQNTLEKAVQIRRHTFPLQCFFLFVLCSNELSALKKCPKPISALVWQGCTVDCLCVAFKNIPLKGNNLFVTRKETEILEIVFSLFERRIQL